MLQRLEKLSEIQFKTKFQKLILNVRVDDEEAQIQQAPQAALNEQITDKKTSLCREQCAKTQLCMIYRN